MTRREEQIAYTQRGARPQAAAQSDAFHRWVLPDGRIWTLFYRRGKDYLVRFPGLADFEVSADGRNLEAWPTPDVDRDTLEHLRLNQAAPLALSRQGRLVLHASAVEADDGCVAFLGASGQGKSTLAASFARAGHPFLTDDGLQVDGTAKRMLIIPSHPSIRLWEDSREVLAGDSEMAARIKETDKARVLAGKNLAYCDRPQRLLAIYLLGSGAREDVAIEAMPAATAVLELVRHSFLLDVDEKEQLALHFDDVTRIIAKRPLFRLEYPRRFEALPDVRAAVLSHLRSLEAP